MPGNGRMVRRFGFSAEQKHDVWRRWKAGQTLHEIGRAFGKEHSSIRCLVSRHGGIAPAVRRRARFTTATICSSMFAISELDEVPAKWLCTWK
jgi:hypothetical protein